MFAFFEYIRNITYYLLFASLVGMIAPPGKYKKFVSLVMGFILLLMVMQPFVALTGGPLPVTEWFTGLVLPPSENADGITVDYEHWRYTHIRAAFEEQLNIQVEGLLATNGFTLHDASFTYAEDFSRLHAVRAVVSPRDNTPQRVPFIRIQPVQIGDPDTFDDDPIVNEVRNLIARFYNLPTEHIHVEVINE